jgi:hypothetical protein
VGRRQSGNQPPKAWRVLSRSGTVFGAFNSADQQKKEIRKMGDTGRKDKSNREKKKKAKLNPKEKRKQKKDKKNKGMPGQIII